MTHPLQNALFARALEGATGAVDWTDGKRRRVIFFDHGRVVLAQSNLRGETPERLAEADPSLTGEKLALAAGRARLAGAMREAEGELKWVPGATPPKQEPVDLAEIVHLSGTRRPGITAYLKIAGAGGGWLHRQAMPPGLADYLADLDGTRTFDEVLAFAPGGPEEAERWIRVLFTMGALVDAGIETATYEVRSVHKKRDWGGGVDDIASMIADGLGQEAPAATRAAAADPITARFGPVLPRVRAAKDHFSVLGVSWQDPPETMRRAYFTLARELHPDRFVGEPAEVGAVASELFDKIRSAWEVLGDDASRDAYIKRVIKGEKTEDELAMEKVRAILDAEADFKKGLAEFNSGRLAQAYELFNRAAAAVPEETEFAAYAGYLTFKFHHGRDAEKANAGVTRLREALAANEKLDAGWVLMGLVLHAQGQLTEAREAYVRALRIKPSNPDAVREMKRLEREKQATTADTGSLFNKFFGTKK